jgi:predicted RNase H-like nuclease
MLEHLRLAAWPSPVGVVLDEIETAVLAQLMPPLNLDKVATPWRAQVRSGRRRLAAQAEAWMPATSREPVSISEEAPTSRRLPAGAVGRVVGIDAAGNKGWVGVVLETGGFRGARLGSLREIIDWAEPVDAIGVDIPIGHVGGSRRADVEARRFVGARGSSVFPAPPAEVLGAATYGQANEMLTAMGVQMVSRQAWALGPKIIEAALIADSDPRVFEVHPEVSFRELAGDSLAWSKKSWNGLLLRRRLLAEAGIVLPDVIADVGGAVSDDIVDAAVAAWSARRIATESARSFPDPPEELGGRRVAIWC